MKKHAFEIYNASAGSGKTYTLVREYLKILLTSKRDDAYKNILAITFTNKAVEEMKTRIVGTLEEFSKENPDKKANDMLLDIAGQTGMTPKAIQEKSQRIIKNIIHNYASFDISTIDKFTHRVIRSFALDLDLPLSFEVSLDTESLLSEAVDSVIAQAGEDENLTKLLVDFATEKADDDKSWDVTREFLEISKLLTNENNRTEISHFQDKTISEFLKIKQNIQKICTDLENEIIAIAQNTLQQIENKGIQHNSFNRSYVPKLLEKIAGGTIEINTNHYKRLEEGGERYAKSVPQNQKDLVDEIALSVLDNLKNINQKAGKLFFYKAFLKNLTPLSVLNTVNQELLKIQQDQNILSISEFNNIIHKEIKEQPAPFIYERLGDRYNHFFIDEFQDTSQLQWENLTPLIDNALSGQNEYGEAGSLMIVGDPKQSIYRWRGGKAEQFIRLSNCENPFSNPDKKVENLETNYRSFSEIIGFNNDFFGFLANEFSDEDYQKIYQNSPQKLNSNIGGYVNISFINENDLSENEDDELSEKSDLYLKSVMETIEKVRNRGFDYREIVILVRRNSEGVLIANHLTENNIPIVSSETLLISNSDEVTFLINLLEFIKNRKNTQAKANFLYYLGRNLGINPIHDFLKKGIEFHNEKEFEEWLQPFGIEFSFEEIRRKPLYEATEILVETFLKKSNNIYIQSFLDLVLEQNIRSQSNIDDFLEFWKKDGHKKSIPSPKGNAIQIMTIHKSKGLEFPVVIFPFADQNYSRKKDDNIWIDNNLEEIELPKVLVSNSSSVENYSDKAKETYYTKNQEELLDNINVIYVALTRAVEQLYIISKVVTPNKEGKLPNTMSSFFIRFLEDKKVFDKDKLEYSFGESVRKSVKKEEKDNRKIIRPVGKNFDAKNIRISTLEAIMWDTKQQQSIEYGNLVHEVLSMIHSDKDINRAIDFSIDKGLITLDKKEKIRNTIEKIILHQDLRDFYNSDYKILNERNIIRKGKSLAKPDKAVLKPDNQAMILDYKTGKKNENHKQQVENYAQALEEMNLKVTQKTLVYIGEDIEVVNL